jgi:hypothetical protein
MTDKGAHMSRKKQGPSWWLLYLSLPMIIGLFLIEMRLSLSDTEHRLAELIILLAVFGSIWLWLRANTGALIQEDLESWRAALSTDSRLISVRSVKIVRTDGNLNRRPRRVLGSIYRRLAGWASMISGFFH